MVKLVSLCLRFLYWYRTMLGTTKLTLVEKIIAR